jgi:GNAT superfamily N-acetyltransferase
MDVPIVELTDAVKAEDADVISEGLRMYNGDATGTYERKLLAVLVRDPKTGKVVGGLTGRSYMGLLMIDFFHLPESLRGAGLGSRILRMAEEEGRRRGCVTATLNTFNFQAPEFYQRHGWQVLGKVAGLPPGTHRFTLSKPL